MEYVKFQKPYLLMGHLETFSLEDRETLENNAEYMRDDPDFVDSDDEPKWLRNKSLKLIETIERTDGRMDDEPKEAYIVEYNGIRFVIGSRNNREKPSIIPLVPEELFEI